MKIKFVSKYKSIPSEGEQSLPNFCILTGFNGSGKSHLLKAMEQGNIQVLDENGNNPEKKYLHSIDLVPQATPASTPQASEQAYTLILQWCDTLVQQGRTIINEQQFITQQPPGRRDINQQQLNPALQRLLKMSFDDGKRALTRFDVRATVRFDELEKFDGNEAFHQKFSTSFLRYFQDLEQNHFARFQFENGSIIVPALSDKEFQKLKGPPPWDLINKMLARMELPYKINEPNSSDATFTAMLTNTQNSETIEFMDLSSGEQVLCGLAISLYQMGAGTSFPGLLLLDELDAHLHPKMMEDVLNVLTEDILPILSCGLIVTTHSPSTCALAPPSSVFRMDPVSRRPLACSIEEALNILAVGVPLSIRREDDKQVVVESDADANIYQGLFSILWRVDEGFKSGPNLNFVSSRTGWRTGSCEHAQRICNAFREAGSNSTYALIDHDNNNTTSAPIFVAGDGERYSIENFVYSPRAISALLIHYLGRGHPDIPNFLSEFGNGSIGSLDQKETQQVNDAFCNHIENSICAARDSSDLANKFPELDFAINEQVDVADYSDQISKLPKWYLVTNGHKLEEALRFCFPRLLEFRNEAGKLLNEIRVHVFDCEPNLIPKALVQSLIDIQNSSD